MEVTQNEHSMMQLIRLYFNEFSFENSGLQNEQEDPKMTVSMSVSPIDDTKFTVILIFKVDAGKSYRLSCSLTGIFEVAGGLTDENAFLQKNAIAVMFPYLRSQITLLTSQPGMTPLIIPILNINTLLESDD